MQTDEQAIPPKRRIGFVRTQLWHLGNKYRLWFYRKFEVAKVEGIALIDPSDAPYFIETITAAIQLVKRDGRRFRRLCRHVERIENTTLAFGGAKYRRANQACEMEFKPPQFDYEVKFYAAWWACVLVHESTHGFLFARKIPYSPNYRRRVERICVAEERRFAQRLCLDPEVVAWLKPKFVFNPDRWKGSWSTTDRQQTVLALKKFWRESRKRK